LFVKKIVRRGEMRGAVCCDSAGKSKSATPADLGIAVFYRRIRLSR
jgi:hypothetical protein